MKRYCFIFVNVRVMNRKDMIELQEYVYIAFTGPEEGFVNCRYCNEHVDPNKYNLNMLGRFLKIIQNVTICHQMGCKAFNEFKKSELEECGI